MDEIKPIPASILLIGERKPMLLPELASFTYLAFPAAKLRQSGYYSFQLQFLKLSKIDVVDLLVS